MRIRNWIKMFVPPVVWAVRERFRKRAKPQIPEWEYLPGGWPSSENSPEIKGWGVQEIVDAYKSRWPGFLDRLNSTSPLDVSPEAPDPTHSDMVFHNTVMSFAYVLALAAHQKNSISMLDWGGGLGHYYQIARSLLPGVDIDYHCKDVAPLADYGGILWPEAHFYVDRSCFQRHYDLVLASGSMHFSQDWRELLRDLGGATDRYLFVTRLPTVTRAESFVFVQRPYAYGYNTEYAAWCLNQDEFLQAARKAGLQLIREFVTGEQPVIVNAPEQCIYRGYLFRPERMTR
jgi:putative methyltransferase (TIGR04325 family)